MKVFTKMVLDARWTHVISGRDSSWWIAHLANDTFATVTIWENAFSVSVWGFFFLLQVFRFCAFSWNKSTFGCICYVHKSSHSFRNGKSWKIWIWVLFFVLGVCSVVASVRREMCQKMSHPVTRNDENKLWLWFNVTLARLTCPSATVPTFNICFSFFSSVSCHSHSMLSAPLSLVFGRAGDINAYHTCDLF